jgi:hypothetical protein
MRRRAARPGEGHLYKNGTRRQGGRAVLRRASVLLGMAVLLSLLFPLPVLLKQAGIDPIHVPVPGADLAALGVLLAIVPSMLMFRDGQLAQRIPRWSVRVALLAACSAAFLLLHMHWSHDLLSAQVQEAGLLPSSVSHLALLDALELAARIGVLLAVVAVLLRLDAPAADEAPVRRRKGK